MLETDEGSSKILMRLLSPMLLLVATAKAGPNFRLTRAVSTMQSPETTATSEFTEEDLVSLFGRAVPS